MAPYKSEAERKYMNAAAARGDIPKSTVDEFNKASKGMTLPQHIKHTMPHINKMLNKKKK